MKRILLILFLSSQGHAAAKKFSCVLDKLPGETFTFKLKDFGTSAMDLVYSDSFHGPVYTSSRNKGIHRIVETLIGEEVTLKKKRASLQIVGQKIGCDFVHLNLSKSSGYKRGTIKADFQCSDIPVFRDKVTCAIK